MRRKAKPRSEGTLHPRRAAPPARPPTRCSANCTRRPGRDRALAWHASTTGIIFGWRRSIRQPPSHRAPRRSTPASQGSEEVYPSPGGRRCRHCRRLGPSRSGSRHRRRHRAPCHDRGQPRRQRPDRGYLQAALVHSVPCSPSMIPNMGGSMLAPARTAAAPAYANTGPRPQGAELLGDWDGAPPPLHFAWGRAGPGRRGLGAACTPSRAGRRGPAAALIRATPRAVSADQLCSVRHSAIRTTRSATMRSRPPRYNT